MSGGDKHQLTNCNINYCIQSFTKQTTSYNATFRAKRTSLRQTNIGYSGIKFYGRMVQAHDILTAKSLTVNQIFTVVKPEFDFISSRLEGGK